MSRGIFFQEGVREARSVISSFPSRDEQKPEARPFILGKK